MHRWKCEKASVAKKKKKREAWFERRAERMQGTVWQVVL